MPDQDLLAKKIHDLNLYDDDHIENNEKIEYLKEVEEAALKKKLIYFRQYITNNQILD